MKILHVIANLAPRYGGPSKACWEMARAVAQLGHEVSIYTTNQDGPGELEVPVGQPVWQEGVEIRYFPIQPPRFWGTSLPLALGPAPEIPASDLVHIHSLYLFHDLVAGHYCRQYGIPYLMRPHGTLDPFIHRRHRWRKRLMELWFENRNIRGAAALHFTTAQEQELAAPYTFGTPGLVVPLGIDLDEFAAMPEPGSFRRRHPEIGDKHIILFFGRVNFKKGLDILAKAFGAVARRRQDVHLVIAGPDNEGWGARVRTWLDEEGVLGPHHLHRDAVGAGKIGRIAGRQPVCAAILFGEFRPGGNRSHGRGPAGDHFRSGQYLAGGGSRPGRPGDPV